MSVKRCGFGVDGENGKILRVDVDIDWDLGFDRNAKTQYIKRLHNQLQKHGCEGNIIDVTSASNQIDRQLSPYYMISSSGATFEDVWNVFNRENPEVCEIPGIYEYMYIIHLSDSLRKYVMTTDWFTDVFFNPIKDFATQAKACAIYKLMCEQAKRRKEETMVEELLGSPDSFVKWYEEVTKS